jgi:hypothetical protein
MDDTELGRFKAASQFVSKVWGKLDDPDSFYAKAAQAATEGSSRAKDTVKRDMDTAAAPYLAVFETPEAARWTVAIHGLGRTEGKLPRMEMGPSEFRKYDTLVKVTTEDFVNRLNANPQFQALPEEEKEKFLRQARERARESSAKEFLESVR